MTMTSQGRGQGSSGFYMCIWIPCGATAARVAEIAVNKFVSSQQSQQPRPRPRPSTAPEVADDKDKEMIKRSQGQGSQEVLQRHHGDTPVHRSGKRGSPSPSTPPKQIRMGQRRTQCSKFDDNINLCQVDVRCLRYSQESCGQFFQCGRPVIQLVKSLWEGQVSLSEPFLQLSVFEAMDRKTCEPILTCIDNRRLYALKKYADLLHDDEPLMVNVNLFSNATIMEVMRYIRNSDNTEGRTVRLRRLRSGLGKDKDKGKRKRGPRIRNRT